jgi:endoglucanase
MKVFFIPSVLAAALMVGCQGSHQKDSRESDLASVTIGKIDAQRFPYDTIRLKMMAADSVAQSKEFTLTADQGSEIKTKVVPGKYDLFLSYMKGDKTVLSNDFCQEKSVRFEFKGRQVNKIQVKLCEENKQKVDDSVYIDPKKDSEVTITPTMVPDPSTGEEPQTPAVNPGNGQADHAKSDNIYGQQVDRSQSWYVANGNIYHAGREVQLKGVNWFGFDTPDLLVHGLWSGQSMEQVLDTVKKLGFNAMRVPVSPEALEPGELSNAGHRPPHAEARDNLKALISFAQKRGINILLDIHNCNKNAGHATGRPDATEVCGNVSIDSWLASLDKLANLSKGYTNVVGIDLYNEPYKLSWKEWKAYVSRGSKKVLTINPKLLVFVEGVGGVDTKDGGKAAFWGENLVEALSDPLDVPASRLVFSPHVYGPSVFAQPYFDEPAFPSNMSQIWDSHFGYLRSRGYVLAIGEFGGRYRDADKQWQDNFVKYLKAKGIKHFFYWSLNPNSSDTGGILKDDWKTLNEEKVNLLKPLLQ